MWRRPSQTGTPGRPAISIEARELIRNMWQCNPTRGSPRKPTNSTRSASMWPNPRWKSTAPEFDPPPLPHGNHSLATTLKIPPSAISSPCHPRHTGCCSCSSYWLRSVTRIVHFNVTEHPTATWMAQQIVEAFPWDTAPRYLLRDRDGVYGEHFQHRIKSMGIEEVKTAPRSPWQNHLCLSHRQHSQGGARPCDCA